jgi:hypothetical protein
MATVRYTGSACTVTRRTPESVRFWATITATVLLLFAQISAVETRRWPWLPIIALILLAISRNCCSSQAWDGMIGSIEVAIFALTVRANWVSWGRCRECSYHVN